MEDRMSLTNKEDPIDYFLNACDKAQIVYKIADQLGERFGSQSNLLRADLQQVLQLGRQALINYHLMPDDCQKSKLELLNVLQLTMDELRDEVSDFLELKRYSKWKCNSAQVSFVYNLSIMEDYSYKSYSSFIEKNNIDKIANLLICVIDQTSDELRHEIHILERSIKRSMSITKIKDKLSRV